MTRAFLRQPNICYCFCQLQNQSKWKWIRLFGSYINHIQHLRNSLTYIYEITKTKKLNLIKAFGGTATSKNHSTQSNPQPYYPLLTLAQVNSQGSLKSWLQHLEKARPCHPVVTHGIFGLKSNLKLLQEHHLKITQLAIVIAGINWNYFYYEGHTFILRLEIPIRVGSKISSSYIEGKGKKNSLFKWKLHSKTGKKGTIRGTYHTGQDAALSLCPTSPCAVM